MTEMNDCVCDYGGDGEYAEFSRTQVVTARKIHKCCECHQEIRPGQQYEHVKGFWSDGGFMDFKTCIPCATIRKDLFCGLPFEALQEELRECLDVELV
ncbi:MAG: hypothetical protein WC891_08700 [Actinomycetota bacterium]|jgi:hypothetical protein